MAKLLVMYCKPRDAQAFDAYYFDRHVPLARTIPGVVAYEVSDGAVVTPQGPSEYHLIATLTFASMESLQAAFASPEGQRTAADLANFADGGAQMLIFDSREI